MKLIKGGLVAAVLALFALTFASSSALADPIGGPWTGSGSINLDGGLGGSDCAAFSVAGATDGNSIDTATFASCRGAAGTPTALTSWAVSWNARNTGGTIDVRALANVSGLAQCLYSGTVSFTYSAGVITIGPSTVPLFVRLSGLNICPANVEVTGSVTI